ncbi:unnamed protein product [Alternaria sp. RS040]
MTSPYKKLHGKSIRILHLDPASEPSSNISGSLHETSLQNPVAYDALSYEWGAPEPGFSIGVGNGSIQVTKNCYEALLRLRHRARKRKLWIDAICIDQRDEKDKSHQVAMMTDIYSKADRVIVWLGESTPESDYALAWCQHVSRMSFDWHVAKFNYRPNLLRAKERRRVATWIRERGTGYALSFRSRWFTGHEMHYKSESMQDLFNRGWFTRTWTIQEVALASAPLVMCGGKTILWGNLMSGFHIAFEHENTDTVRSARNAASCIETLWLCLLQKSWDDSYDRYYETPVTLFSSGWKEDAVRRFRALKEFCVSTLLVFVTGMAVNRFGGDHWLLENNDWDAWIFFILIFSIWFLKSFLNPSEGFAEGRQQLLRDALINNINLVRPRGATDLRDKVFALYGAFQALGITLDEPEYEHSTVADVYFRFARRIVEWQNNLDILIEASLPSYPGTPTWVPDLSREYHRWGVQHAKAAGNSAPDFTYLVGILRTAGLLVDVVIETNLAVESDGKFSFLTIVNGYEGITQGPVQAGDLIVLISGLRVPMVLRGVGEGYHVIGMAEVKGIMDGEAWDDKALKTMFDLV